MDHLIAEALVELASWDHGFITPEGARLMAKKLGVDPARIFIGSEINRPREFKGLNCPGFRDGEAVPGIAAHALAEQICLALKVDYCRCHGKGFQLRACLEALRGFFKVKVEVEDR